MADSYIDPNETLVYGTHALQMIDEHLRPLAAARGKHMVAVLDLVAETQGHANDAMRAMLARAPEVVSDDAAITRAQDAMRRFGSWIGSLEGAPLTVEQFFGNVVPAQAAKRRGAKMVGVLGQVVERLGEVVKPKDKKKPKKIDGAEKWLADLTRIHAAADRTVKAKTKLKVDQRTLSPELAGARADWLAIYAANKLLIEGVLRHLGKTSLMDIVFDDLAEVQRTAAASTAPAAPAADAAAAATTKTG